MPEIIQLPQNGGNQNGGMSVLPVANGGGLFGNNGQRDAYGRNGAENRNQL